MLETHHFIEPLREHLSQEAEEIRGVIEMEGESVAMGTRE